MELNVFRKPMIQKGRWMWEKVKAKVNEIERKARKGTQCQAGKTIRIMFEP